MYIPKGQIKQKYYYTDGGEYKISTNVEYIGYYHKDNFDNVWTGQTHTNESVLLVSFIPTPFIDKNSSSDVNVIIYNKLNKTSNILGANALPIIPSNFEVNNKDYELGFLSRYFVKYKASSSPKFDEINESTYKSAIQNPTQYHSDMYIFVTLLWRVRGPLSDQYKNNILVKPGVYDSNQRSLKEAEKTCPEINLYLTNLIEKAIIEP